MISAFDATAHLERKEKHGTQIEMGVATLLRILDKQKKEVLVIQFWIYEMILRSFAFCTSLILIQISENV